MAETKLKPQSTLAPPQGFLYNGKIVPSVASNNLTVALKGLDGNDPSATNPVYVRIGDSVRSITAALSVTKNAGTNWCNAGSAELATKEIDYFVYLGYNATDGVVIGFSRIPYANSYGGFSATTTNEKYCAISTITTATSADYYQNIGRFAATLSAGAGYTWTVPTFSAINLIQAPIYSTRVLIFVPQLTGCTAATYGSGSFRYQLVGSQLIAEIGASAFMTSNATTKSITMPFTLSSSSSAQGTQYPVRGYDNGAPLTSPAILVGAAGSATFDLYKDFSWGAWTNSGLWLGQGFASYELL